MITKGPWAIEKNEDTGCWMVVTQDGNEIYSVSKSESDWENVCLARSGPYLMEALEEILATLDPDGNHPFFGKARVSLQYAKLSPDE
jgi:hypothetical protein